METQAGESPSIEVSRRVSEGLREGEERLRAILETAVEGIITIDERGRIESVNRAAEEIFGYKEREILGENVHVLMPQPYRDEHDDYLKNYLRSGEAKIIGIGREVAGRRKSGEVFPMDLAVSEVRLAKRRVFTGFVRDISERKVAEQNLRRYEQIVSSSSDMLSFVDRNCIFRAVNESYVDCLGMPQERIIGHTIEEVFGEEFYEEICGPAMEQCLAGREARYETEFHSPRKGACILDVRLTPHREADGLVSGAVINARDVTERRELEKGILDARHCEQQRIGRELHDNLGQQLTGIEFMSQALEHKLASAKNRHAADAAEIARLVRQAITHTRGLSRGLDPIMVESEGLMAALRDLAENTERVFSIKCHFDCPRPVYVKDNSTAIHLFRIAQESVNNAIKHGKPGRIEIALKDSGDRILLAVKDDGHGLPDKPKKKAGMGLRIMQYRAGIIGGSLVIQRPAAGGAEIVCSVCRGQAKKTS